MTNRNSNYNLISFSCFSIYIKKYAHISWGAFWFYQPWQIKFTDFWWCFFKNKTPHNYLRMYVINTHILYVFVGGAVLTLSTKHHGPVSIFPEIHSITSAIGIYCLPYFACLHLFTISKSLNSNSSRLNSPDWKAQKTHKVFNHIFLQHI